MLTITDSAIYYKINKVVIAEQLYLYKTYMKLENYTKLKDNKVESKYKINSL